MAMTASMTRSRRAEGPRLTHSPIRPKIVAISPNANLNGTKRKYDQSSLELDQIVTKKPRFTTSIAVEIPAAQLDTRPNKPAAPTRSVGPIPIHPSNPSRAATSTTTTAVKDTSTTNTKPSRTKHQEKVANGLKHELNRLQPSLPPDADLKSQGRKLRSQEQSRFKSELSTYFPEYDEVIGNEPKERHLINVDTPIAIVPGVGAGPESRPSLDESGDSQQHTPEQPYTVRGYGDNLFTDLFDSQTVDFSFLASGNQKRKSQKDPLPDSIFEPWHKKEERAERSARNTEKGRAQHEKEQIIRLLEGLQGHDWLRVMGVSGITESKKKTFEPARDHFIKGCEAILEKFRRWAAEEKRRKREKDRAHAEAEARKKAAEQQEEEEDDAEEEEDGEDPIDEEEDEEEETEEIQDTDGEIDGDEQDDKDDESDGDPPDYDVDASIAKQLREEAIAAAKKKSRGKRARDSPRPLPQPEPEFKSFFKKPHERAQALNKGRRRGRTAKAWGEPVPEVKEAEYTLPEELDVDNKEFMTWWGREKRTRKRRKV